MSHVVTWRKQAFSGTVLARGRFKTLVEFETVNPTGTRVQWFARWRVKPSEHDVARRACLHRPQPCCERFGR